MAKSGTSQIESAVGATSTITTTGPGASSSMTETAVRNIIQSEFKEAMRAKIMPELESELKSVLSKIKEPITNVNKIFYEKLCNEEEKSDHMVRIFESKIQQLQQ